MLSAPKCFKACGIAQSFRQMNRLGVGRNSNLLYRFDCCRKAFGGDSVLRGDVEGLRNRSYLRDVGFTSNHTGLVRKSGFFKHLNGFLSDSPSWRGSKASHDANLLHRGQAFFSTAANNATDTKQIGAGKPIQKDPVKKGASEEQIADMRILRTLAKYLWLKDNIEFRFRVLIALGLLVGAKVLNVQVPFLFKLAVDWLSTVTGAGNTLASFTAANSTLLAVFVSPAAVLVGYGIARAGASACNELRNAVFSKVALRAIRTVSRKVFSHLLDLDLQYHLSRQTGALNRIIDRGSRAINFILTAMVFNVVPTVLEISMVSGILAYKYGTSFAWITSLSVATYVTFTLIVTQWRTKFRQAMNKADNDASSRAIDSLINYETVKYFDNESYEVQKYDEYLKRQSSLCGYAVVKFFACLSAAIWFVFSVSLKVFRSMNLPWSSLDLKVTIKFEVGVWVLLTDLLMHYLMGVLESGDVLHQHLYFGNFIRQVFL